MTPDDLTRTSPPDATRGESDPALDAGLAAAFGGDTTALRPPPAEPEAGAVIAGRYRLTERIGEGGMGSVWAASQTEPVKRKVAVKLIKAGMDSRVVLARFEAERQALAVMDHPHIAKVLDGGLHDGRPYFVMELVKGVKITEYCDERKLTPAQRLELFVPVCQAIQHAHQKGVIHRDIKPSNVLVALYDDKPVPKVIDFGVAKATGAALTEHTLETGFGTVLGTPAYMSPEQASLNNLDIDTRSDVYSLGILLYELLTGSPPFSRKELGQKGLLEILRVVREEEPPRPSAKLSTADALPTLSANRGTEPKALTGLLRNELDWIVMKALEKDRARRYDTANGFAADVLRYLSGEAVQAHPPSTAYRVKKFVRRNKVQVVAAGLVFLALVAGIVGTTFGLIRARAEADAKERALEQAEHQRKEAVANFELANKAVEEYLLKVSQDERLQQQDLLELRKQLAASARTFFEQFLDRKRDDPTQRLAVARALFNLASIDGSLRQHADAIRHLTEAKATVGALLAADPGNQAARLQQGRVCRLLLAQYEDTNDTTAGLSLVTESEVAAERLAADFPEEREVLEERAMIQRNIAGVYKNALDFARAEEHAARSVAYQREVVRRFPEVSTRFVLVRNSFSLAFMQRSRRRLTEAKATLVVCMAEAERILRDAPRHAQNRFIYARILREQMMIAIDENRPDDELTFARRQVSTLRELVEDFPSVPVYRSELVEAIFGLGEGLSEQNKHDDALRYCAEAVELGERLAKRFPELSDVALCHAMAVYGHARALTRAGKLEDGLRVRRRAVELSEDLVRRNPNEAFYSTKLGKHRIGLMFSLIQLNRFDEALTVGDQAFTQLAEHIRRHPEFKEVRLDFALVCTNIGTIQTQRQEFRRAEEVLTAGLDTLTVPGGLPDGWKQTAGKLRILLAQAQAHQQKFTAADESLEAARKLNPKFPEITTIEMLIAQLKKQTKPEVLPPPRADE